MDSTLYTNSTKRGTAVLSLQYSRDLGASGSWTPHTIPVPDTTGLVDGVNFVVTPIAGSDHNQVQVTGRRNRQGVRKSVRGAAALSA